MTKTRLEAIIHKLDDNRDRMAILTALMYAQLCPVDFSKRYGTYGQDCVERLLDPANKVEVFDE